MSEPPIPRRVIHALAGAADVDPSTVRLVLSGAPLTSPARRRVAEVLQRRGQASYRELMLGLPPSDEEIIP